MSGPTVAQREGIFRAVAEAAEEPDADLVAVATNEATALWHDFGTALRAAANGDWSIGCEGIAWRLVLLARAGIVVPWGDVSAEVTLSGLYEEIYKAAGVTYPPIDWDTVRRVYEYNHRGLDTGHTTGPV